MFKPRPLCASHVPEYKVKVHGCVSYLERTMSSVHALQSAALMAQDEQKQAATERVVRGNTEFIKNTSKRNCRSVLGGNPVCCWSGLIESLHNTLYTRVHKMTYEKCGEPSKRSCLTACRGRPLPTRTLWSL